MHQPMIYMNKKITGHLAVWKLDLHHIIYLLLIDIKYIFNQKLMLHFPSKHVKNCALSLYIHIIVRMFITHNVAQLHSNYIKALLIALSHTVTPLGHHRVWSLFIWGCCWLLTGRDESKGESQRGSNEQECALISASFVIVNAKFSLLVETGCVFVDKVAISSPFQVDGVGHMGVMDDWWLDQLIFDEWWFEASFCMFDDWRQIIFDDSWPVHYLFLMINDHKMVTRSYNKHLILHYNH